ncbi:hypothetical protein, partial [Escherichia coli]|uniref:hypothetical protein n=1 Tax=Escherichia coli TaxID=562 RepID=UPI001BB1800A
NASYLTVICNCFEPVLPKPSVSALLKLKVSIFRLSLFINEIPGCSQDSPQRFVEQHFLVIVYTYSLF